LRCQFSFSGFGMSLQEEPRQKRIPWNILKVILALIFTGFVLSKTNFQGLFALRNQISAGWLISVFLLFGSLTILKSLQYYFLIGRQVSYSEILNIVIIQNAISNFIATSAGIASYIAMFSAGQGVNMSKSTLVFVLAKICDLIAIWLFLAVAVIMTWSQIVPFHSLVIFILTVIGLALVVFFVAIFFRQKFTGLLVAILNRLNLMRIAIVSKSMGTMLALVEQEQSFIFRIINVGILFSTFYMLVTLAWLYASLRAFSFEIDVLPTVFVNSLLQLISYIPVQIFGGLGITEASMLYFYGPFNLPEAEITTVLVANRLLFYLANLVVLLYLPVGKFLFGRSRKS
jgi:uncharacterized membrane protein YbhN (UPF0104 family)